MFAHTTEPYLKNYINGLFAERVALSAYTNEDSENNAMLRAHAYKAQTDGFVSVTCVNDSNETLSGYVGLTNDPAGAGDLIQRFFGFDPNAVTSLAFLVAKDEYFEVTYTGTQEPVIWWKSFGALQKPIDFN